MHKTITILNLLFILVISSSCTSTTNCSIDEYYSIDYFNSGGFTAIERGTSVDCSGWLKKWERKLNSSKVILDSIKIDNKSLASITKAMNDESTFNYSINKTSNYTTTIILNKKDIKHVISYNSSEIPTDLPESIKTIISEIEKIK